MSKFGEGAGVALIILALAFSVYSCDMKPCASRCAGEGVRAEVPLFYCSCKESAAEKAEE